MVEDTEEEDEVERLELEELVRSPQIAVDEAMRTLERSDPLRVQVRVRWRPVPTLPDLEPIVPADDATALLRSLGPPPLDRHSLAGEHYLATVVERAAALATGLAAAAQVLAEADDDADGRDDASYGGAS